MCAAGRLATVDAAAAERGADQVDVALVVPSGVESLGQALGTAHRCQHLRIVAIELPLGLYPMVDVVSHLVPLVSDECRVYLEVPLETFTEDHAHALAPTGVRLKLRTGGTSIESFHTEDELATPIVMCAAERLAFKCTAGLHNAIRHRAADTLFEHHGFLNVALAARIAAATGSHAATRNMLAEHDPAVVAAQVGNLSAADVRATRALFNSFGTCSIDEPVHDLLHMGLVSVP